MKQSIDYKSEIINYKGNNIQTYKFGTGEKIVLALPSFPHSGIYYLWFVQSYDLSKVTIITFDLPGWVGKSDDIFKRGGFSLDICIEIAKSVIDYYMPTKYGIIGYSFGGALAAKLSNDDPRVSRVVLVSAVVNSALLKGYGPYRIISVAHSHHLGFLLKLYLILRYEWYKRTLAKENISKDMLNFYKLLLKKADGGVLLKSLYALFRTDWSVVIKGLKGKTVLVVSSTDESHYLRLQSEHIRRELGGEESLYLRGAHEDFILKPTAETVSYIINFLLG